MRGKARRRIISRLCLQDHPRLCGEKQTVHASVRGDLGSPPPMRGKAVLRSQVRPRQGITPAYAGKSSLT